MCGPSTEGQSRSAGSVRRSALHVMNYPIAVPTLARGSLAHGHADIRKEWLWMIDLGQPRDKSPHDTSNCCHECSSPQVIAPSMWLLLSTGGHCRCSARHGERIDAEHRPGSSAGRRTAAAQASSSKDSTATDDVARLSALQKPKSGSQSPKSASGVRSVAFSVRHGVLNVAHSGKLDSPAHQRRLRPSQ